MSRNVVPGAWMSTPYRLGEMALGHRAFATGWKPRATGALRERVGLPGGLLISEPLAVTPARDPRTPALCSSEAVNQWRESTEAIHRQGGFVCACLTQAALPVPAGRQAPSDGDLARCFEAFRDAAENALDAGFDAVELAAGTGTAGGQLLDVHASLMGELVQVLLDVWAGRCCVGVHLAPERLGEPPLSLADQLGPGVAWLHLGPCVAARVQASLPAWRGQWPGAVLVSGGFEPEAAHALLAGGLVNLVGVE